MATLTEAQQREADGDEREFPGLVEVYCGQVGALDREGLRRRIEDTFYSGDDIGRLYVASNDDTLVEVACRSTYESTDGGNYMHYRFDLTAKNDPLAVLATLAVRIDGRS